MSDIMYSISEENFNESVKEYAELLFYRKWIKENMPTADKFEIYRDRDEFIKEYLKEEEGE